MNFTEAELAILRQRQADANPSLAPKRRRNPTSEAQIQQTCTQILQHDGWRALRTDPVSDRKRGKGFGEIGMPDYLYIRYSPPCNEGDYHPCAGVSVYVMWIEWKKDGGTPSAEQLAWHAAERRAGALTLIAGVDFEASVSGFMDWYSVSGLKRTNAN